MCRISNKKNKALNHNCSCVSSTLNPSAVVTAWKEKIPDHHIVQASKVVTSLVVPVVAILLSQLHM
jgi:hypothetical protein